MNERLQKLADRLPKWQKILNRMMLTISADIIRIIESKPGMKRKHLAEALGKKESEISKWLSGTHNFTLKSLAKIEEQLGEQFLFTLSEKCEEIESVQNESRQVIVKTLVIDLTKSNQLSINSKGNIEDMSYIEGSF
jgi:transcriptional regulator with XRE-family HTH domain